MLPSLVVISSRCPVIIVVDIFSSGIGVCRKMGIKESIYMIAKLS